MGRSHNRSAEGRDNMEWDEESHRPLIEVREEGGRRDTPDNNERSRSMGRSVSWVKNCLAVTRLSQVNAEAVALRVRLC